MQTDTVEVEASFKSLNEVYKQKSAKKERELKKRDDVAKDLKLQLADLEEQLKQTTE